MNRHRYDVRGNQLQTPSIWPAVALLLLSAVFLAVVLVLTGSFAVADPYPEDTVPAYTYSCDQVEV